MQVLEPFNGSGHQDHCPKPFLLTFLGQLTVLRHWFACAGGSNFMDSTAFNETEETTPGFRYTRLLYFMGYVCFTCPQSSSAYFSLPG